MMVPGEFVKANLSGQLLQCCISDMEVSIPDSKVHGANMGPIWGRQDPGGPHVGPMLAPWTLLSGIDCPLTDMGEMNKCQITTQQWHHNECDGISNHQRLDCLLVHLFRRRSKKTLKLCLTGLCEGNQPVTNEFPEQWASNVENVSIWWHHEVWTSRGK